MADLYGSNKHRGGHVGFFAGLALLVSGTIVSAQALVINVIYPNPDNVPAAAVTEITDVVNLLDSSFVNDATINITVDFTSTCGLSCSSTRRAIATYSQWRTQMIADSRANPQNAFMA